MIFERRVVPDSGQIVFTTPDGKYELSGTHPVTEDCLEHGCVIHNPSDTRQNREGWPHNWRTDRGIMERICEHGVGHPDHDSAAYLARMGLEYENVHGCDFCCGESAT